MGFEFSAFRMTKFRKIDKMMLFGFISSWITTLLFVLFGVPHIFLAIWIAKSLFLTYMLIEHIEQMERDNII